ncbi:MAG: DUF4176 domain-containing protein [Butyrivibrio sp.]|jgi:hypothetical protein|nr:DUF4176 domain-containing protein [Butyrivibrio sp.]
MEIKNILPIGTVVKLKESGISAMICGYCPTGNDREGYTSDYSGFFYPAGYSAEEEILQFDEDMIDEILNMGLQDDAQLEFTVKLRDAIKDIPKQI